VESPHETPDAPTPPPASDVGCDIARLLIDVLETTVAVDPGRREEAGAVGAKQVAIFMKDERFESLATLQFAKDVVKRERPVNRMVQFTVAFAC
jgi:hypothetical protein